MSWLQQNKDYPFSITTGDGKKWNPKIEEENIELAFNMSAYSYRNIEGEFVERKRAKSDVFPIEFTFSGGKPYFLYARVPKVHPRPAPVETRIASVWLNHLPADFAIHQGARKYVCSFGQSHADN